MQAPAAAPAALMLPTSTQPSSATSSGNTSPIDPLSPAEPADPVDLSTGLAISGQAPPSSSSSTFPPSTANRGVHNEEEDLDIQTILSSSSTLRSFAGSKSKSESFDPLGSGPLTGDGKTSKSGDIPLEGIATESGVAKRVMRRVGGTRPRRSSFATDLELSPFVCRPIDEDGTVLDTPVELIVYQNGIMVCTGDYALSSKVSFSRIPQFGISTDGERFFFDSVTSRSNPPTRKWFATIQAPRINDTVTRRLQEFIAHHTQ